MKSIDFLDSVRAAYGLTSDYQLAKKLNVSQPRISNYRRGRTFFDESMAIIVADLLDLNPLYVVACVAAEREERQGQLELEKFWRGVAIHAKSLGATIALP